MLVQAIKHGYVYAWVIIKQISSTQLLLCVCNGSAMRVAPRDVGKCLCTRKIKGSHGCVCLSSSLSCRQLFVCICMLIPLND